MKNKEIQMTVLAAFIVTGFFALLYLMLYVGIPADNKDLFNILAGALVGSFTTVVGWFFGSSKSSAEKTATINTLANNTNK